MPDTSEQHNVQERYAQQLREDLERNEAEQERVNSELTELQRKLGALELDHGVLLSMQGALGSEQSSGGGRSKRAAAGSAAPVMAVPTARRAKDAPAPTGKGGKKAAKAPAKPNKSTSPTLRELLQGYLGTQTEPQTVNEVTAGLQKAHPERKFNPTAVRTALETGVAKGFVERNKQQKSVFYLPVKTGPDEEQVAEACVAEA
ncbi:hypothetical protein [Streptomyces sp. 8N706]|uniref:hypothetical protein n=1 Tax=Streptomyces sp. 8N706 TaxID=3457416 RepID=UPI003FD55495